MEAGERNPDTCGQAERLTSSALAQAGAEASLGTRARCLTRASPEAACHEANSRHSQQPLRAPGGCCESRNVTRSAWCPGAGVWRHWMSERPHCRA